MVQGMPGEVCDAKRFGSPLCAEWFDIAKCEECEDRWSRIVVSLYIIELYRTKNIPIAYSL
jgi:hypothetical protein